VLEIQIEIITAGVDEAGRGPLAGPVIAAAVILDPKKRIRGLTDSKLLTAAKREALFEKIQQRALAWSIGRADVAEIDTINILQATMLAMQRAVARLSIMPTLLLVDGNYPPRMGCKVKTVIKGDLTEPAISAASILAKVTRDREMVQLHQMYPHYNFAQHKGYSTEEHLNALEKHGVCAIHRRSFEPVARLLFVEKIV
jgi:ribonuclease HII